MNEEHDSVAVLSGTMGRRPAVPARTGDGRRGVGGVRARGREGRTIVTGPDCAKESSE